MKDFAILHYTDNHFTGSCIIDAKVKAFKRISEISLLYLTSKTLNLNECQFEFDLNFDNWKNRDYLSTDKVWPIFSNRLVEIIKKHDPEFVYYPTKLVDKKGNEDISNYSVVQIERLSGVVNTDLSIFTRDEFLPQLFSSVKEIVFIDNDNLKPIFRIREFPQVIIVNSGLYYDLMKSELNNITLTNMKDYNWDYL